MTELKRAKALVAEHGGKIVLTWESQFGFTLLIEDSDGNELSYLYFHDTEVSFYLDPTKKMPVEFKSAYEALLTFSTDLLLKGARYA